MTHKMISKEFVSISRPRLWIYTIGPFLIGIVSSGILETLFVLKDMLSFGGYILFILFLFELGSYFSYGSNLLIHGTNDLTVIDDEDEHLRLKHRVITTQVLFFISISVLVFLINIYGQVPGLVVNYLLLVALWVVFLFFGVFLSSKPINAQAKPFLDGLFGIVYVIPAVMTYIAFGGAREMIHWGVVAAGLLRYVATMTFKTIPSMKKDKALGRHTTALYFGEKDTLLYCGGVRLWSAWLAGFALPELKRFFYPAAGVYVLMSALCLFYGVEKITKYFSWIYGITLLGLLLSII